MNEDTSSLLSTTSTGRSGSLGRSIKSRRASLSSIDSKQSDTWVKYLPPDASAPQLCPYTNWRKARYCAFPIELFFLFGMFVYFLNGQLYRQYFFQILSLSSLDINPPSNRSMCYNQSYITNMSNASTFQSMQSQVNLANMYTTVLYLGLSGIASLFLGPLSDIVGRKPILALTAFGMTIGTILQIIIIYFEWKPYTYMISTVFFGGFGGHATLIGLAFAAVSDVTVSNKWLTIRMGIVEAAITVALATSSPALNDWIQSNNCNFRPIVWLMFSVITTALIYIFFIPEPLQLKKDEHISIQNNKLKNLLDGFKCYLWPKYIGFSNWWRLCVVTCIILLECLTVIGSIEIINYFLHNKPLQWTYTRIGNYQAIVATAKGICLIFLLPLLLLLKFSNIIICLIACLFAMVANVMIATVRVNWEMYIGKSQTYLTIFHFGLAGILESVSFLSFPAIRSMLTQLVPSKDLGILTFFIMLSI